MPISRDDYTAIIQRQLSGDLTIFTDTSGFRQLFYRADPGRLTEMVGRPIRTRLALIKILSCTDFLSLLACIGLSIPAFGPWALVAAPTAAVLWTVYRSRASMGRQNLSIVSLFLAVAVAAAVATTAWNHWARAFLVGMTLTFFLIRLLYVITSRLAFNLIHTSYEFFSAFYLEPKDAMTPLIWTEPEFKA